MSVSTSPPVRPDSLPVPTMATPDPFAHDLGCENRHVFDVLKELGNTSRNVSCIHQVIVEELGKLGVNYEFPLRSGRTKTRKSPVKNKVDNSGEMVEVELSSHKIKVVIPIIIKECCDYIQNYLSIKGIFRISGSAQRIATLMEKAETLKSNIFNGVSDPHDVAGVLKQYLRKREGSVIPTNLQSVFLQCVNLEEDCFRSSSVLMATCLLPLENLGIMCYLMEFLSTVAEHSSENLMTPESLAIVIGPNIMSMNPRRPCEKPNDQTRRHVVELLDKHKTIVEILIRNSGKLGVMEANLIKKIDAVYSCKSSEDELESEGIGRRKKRRSGSLNRMLGFLKKVTRNNGMDTPLPSTPGADGFLCTPVIKDSSKKKTNEDTIFALYRKKHILDGRKNLNAGSNEILGTPLSFASPGVCLDPSPAKCDWKQTPNGNRLKHLVTPGNILRKRLKSDNTEKTASSAPAKASKTRLRFGKRVDKECLSGQTQGLKKGPPPYSSMMSIHNLPNSPRQCQVATSNKESQNRSPVEKTKEANSSEGDYVTISEAAELKDVRNEAFIASSSMSLTDSECEPQSVEVKPTAPENNEKPDILLTDIVDSTLDNTGTTLEFPYEEITTFTRQIEMLTDSTKDLLPASANLTSEQVPIQASGSKTDIKDFDTKFEKTLKEIQVIHVTSRNSNPKAVNALHRRLSVQEKRMSPSQRRISNMRRRTHEIRRVTTPVNPPRFHSLRNSSQNLEDSASSIQRSLARCTLKRGRPNTTRVGLARPSPVRTNSKTAKIVNTKIVTEDKQESTPMRRMSSVQELVKKLEVKRNSTTEKVHDKQRSGIPVPENIITTPTLSDNNRVQTRYSSKARAKERVDLKLFQNGLTKPSPLEGKEWVDGEKFNFDRKNLFGNCQRNSDRDSIHFLKTLRAGKVPATVEYFNQIGKYKSPSKSMIPRYTALHNYNLRTPTPDKMAVFSKPDSTERLSRRLSSVEIRNKHEQLLESIKNERRVKRSATTAGSYDRKETHKKRANPNFPTGYTSGEVHKGAITRSASRRTPNPKTPRIEEEDPLTIFIDKESTSLRADKKYDCNLVQAKTTPIIASPLKTSNLANITKEIDVNLIRNDKLGTQKDKGRHSQTINRTVSEKGTTATTRSTPRTTPSIKKSLTTRAYDCKFKTSANAVTNFTSQAHSCQTITPRRRMPRTVPKYDFRHCQTPLKTTYEP